MTTACLNFVSPIGPLAVRATSAAVVEVRLGGVSGDSVSGDGVSGDGTAAALCERARAELAAYLAGDLRDFTLPVKPDGAQAVGMACGANPIPLIIPCHRVVAANGLGGFSGGIDRKRWLLDLERGQGRIF
jgi:methylated-DNA-[protein]-cysteine S-methyltransferase